MRTSTPPSTRTALLDAAERLFSERGYTAVGIREIAETAGVNLAAINYHFGSKGELYLETVRRAMGNRGDGNPWDLLQSIPDRRDDAAVLLVRFIRQFMKQLLPAERMDVCGTLIIREGIEPTEALDTVMNEYLQPNEAMLRSLVRVIVPDATEPELARHVVSIFGQMVHYRTFRPIIERMWQGSLSEPQRFDAISTHVAQFTLRGLGSTDECAERAMAGARELNDRSIESGKRVQKESNV